MGRMFKFLPNLKVMGLTSLVYGNPKELGGLHVFMCDIDVIEKHVLLEVAETIHEKNGIDVYVFETFPLSFHLVSFDVLTVKEVNHILKWIPVNVYYPLLGERIHDNFLTLRITPKNEKKKFPKFVERFISCNKHIKSLHHYLVYRGISDIPEAPEYYKFIDCPCFFVSYTTRFDTSKKRNINEILEHDAGHQWKRCRDVTRNTLKGVFVG